MAGIDFVDYVRYVAKTSSGAGKGELSTVSSWKYVLMWVSPDSGDNGREVKDPFLRKP